MRRKRISREQILKARPIINPAVQWSRGEEGEIIITLKRREDWWVKFLSALFVVPRERKIALDEIGSMLWELFDGQHTIKELAQMLAERLKISYKEAELSLTEYLRILARKRLVALIVGEGKDRENGKGDA